MSHADLVILGRVAVALVLSFVIGFERQLRGAPAGDRTYALIGTGSAAITAVTVGVSPQAIGGVVTGIGFVGAGLVFRESGGALRNVTSAATIFAVAAIGIVVGTGHVVLGVAVAAILLLDLELSNIPGLGWLDARRYADRFKNDNAALPDKGAPPPTPGGDAATER
jgi:putative Mg2+ transporter-C (MgtC) family protein